LLWLEFGVAALGSLGLFGKAVERRIIKYGTRAAMYTFTRSISGSYLNIDNAVSYDEIK
jgi:hypothetical protein